MPVQQSGNKIILGTRGFKRVNEYLSPELLGEDELQVMENLVLDNAEKIPSLRQGLSVYNSNAQTQPGGISRLDDYYINYNDYLFGTNLGQILTTPDLSLFVDGDVTVSTYVILTKDMYYHSLTVTNTGTIDCNNFRIFVHPANPLVNNGLIHNDGIDAYSQQVITGMSNNGSGLFRITCPNHGFTAMTNGNPTAVQISQIIGANESAANGTWTISNVTTNTFDLNGSSFANATVSAATNATPIQITTSLPANGYVTGETVVISGVAGNTNANGTWIITFVDSQNFTLNGSVGNGTYGGGGTSTAVLGIVTCNQGKAGKSTGTFLGQGGGVDGAVGPHTGYGSTNGANGMSGPTRATCLNNTTAVSSGPGGSGGNSCNGIVIDTGGTGGGDGSPSSVTLVIAPTLAQLCSGSIQTYIYPLPGGSGSGGQGGGSVTNGVGGFGGFGGATGGPAGFVYVQAKVITGTGSFQANGGKGGDGGVGGVGSGMYRDPWDNLCFKAGAGGGGGSGAGGPGGYIILDSPNMTGFTGTIQAIGGLHGLNGAAPTQGMYAYSPVQYSVAGCTGYGVTPIVVTSPVLWPLDLALVLITQVSANTNANGVFATPPFTVGSKNINLVGLTGNGNWNGSSGLINMATPSCLASAGLRGANGDVGITHSSSSGGSSFISSLNGTGSWSTVKSGLTAPYLCRSASYGGKLFVTNGYDPIFATDMVNAAYNIAITKPLTQGISTASSEVSGNGLVYLNVYLYAIVYGDQDGNLSPVSHPFCFQTALVGDNTNTITNLPVSGNTRVNKRYLYRTIGILPNAPGQTDTNFYLLTTLDNTVTTYIDGNPDTNLGLAYTPELVNIPNFAKYVLVKNDRMFLANIQTTSYNLPTLPMNLNSKFAETDVSSGLIPSSTYKWAASFEFSNGLEGELSDYFTGTTGSVGGSPYKSVSLEFYWPDVNSSLSNILPNVSYINIYRTVAGGSALLFAKQISIATFLAGADGNNVTVIDAVPDASLGSSWPAKSNAATTISYPSRLIFSDNANVGTFQLLNFIDVGGDTGDFIQGLVDDEDGIIVFKQTNIYKLYTNGATSSWYVQRLVSGIGCDEPNSIIKTPFGIFFKNKGYVYNFTSGSQPQIVSQEFVNSIASVTAWMPATFHQPKAWLTYPVSVSGAPYLFILDLKTQAWYKFPVYNGQVSSLWTAYSRKYGADAGKLVTGGDFASTVGFYDPSTNLDTHIVSQTPIAHLRTKIFSFPLSVNLVRPRKLWANLTRLTGSYTLTHSLNGATYADTWTGSPAIDLKLITDAMTTPILTAKNFYYDVQGAGLNTITALQIESTILKRGTRG